MSKFLSSELRCIVGDWEETGSSLGEASAEWVYVDRPTNLCVSIDKELHPQRKSYYLSTWDSKGTLSHRLRLETEKIAICARLDPEDNVAKAFVELYRGFYLCKVLEIELPTLAIRREVSFSAEFRLKQFAASPNQKWFVYRCLGQDSWKRCRWTWDSSSVGKRGVSCSSRNFQSAQPFAVDDDGTAWFQQGTDVIKWGRFETCCFDFGKLPRDKDEHRTFVRYRGRGAQLVAIDWHDEWLAATHISYVKIRPEKKDPEKSVSCFRRSLNQIESRLASRFEVLLFLLSTTNLSWLDMLDTGGFPCGWYDVESLPHWSLDGLEMQTVSYDEDSTSDRRKVFIRKCASENQSLRNRSLGALARKIIVNESETKQIEISSRKWLRREILNVMPDEETRNILRGNFSNHFTQEISKDPNFNLQNT